MFLLGQGNKINAANTKINKSKLCDNTLTWNRPLYKLNPDPID